MASTLTTTAPTLSAAARRVPDPVRFGALALAVLAIEALLARGLVAPGISRFVLLFAGVLAVAFVFRFPLATTFVFLVFTDFIFYPTFFEFELGPVGIRPHELALAALLALALLRPERRSWGGGAGIALAAFLGILAVSGLAALADGRAPLTDVFNWGRPFFALTVFYVVVRLFPRSEQRRALLSGAVAIAAVAGFAAVLVALGWGFGDTIKGTGTQIVRAEDGLPGLLRVRLAGLSLGYGLFWYVAVRVATADVGRRFGWALVMAMISGAIAVSFNRNMWIGLVFGLLLMLLLGGPFVRARFVAAVGAAIAAVILLASVGSTTDSRVLDPVVERGTTLLNPSGVSQESSLSDRERETRIAWATARGHPVLGVGPGASFGVTYLDYLGPNSIRVTPQLFLHNQYLYLLLVAGLPGLVAFLLFLGIPAVRSVTRRPRDPAVLACGVGIAMIMASAVVAIYFSVEDMTALLGMLTGVIAADTETRAADGFDSGLTA